MRRLVHVYFGFSGDESFERAKAILELMGQGHLAIPKPHGGYEFTFDASDYLLGIILPEIQQARRDLPRGFSSTYREERVYSSKELLEAELLLFWADGLVGFGGDKYGTRFDRSPECPGCGTGRVQVSDLIIDKKEMGKKDMAATYSSEYVVTTRVADAIRAYGFTGVELRTVRHKSDRMRNESELWQILPTHTLPPLAEQTRFERTRSCPQCGRGGLFLRSEPYYRGADLEVGKFCDFNTTFEYFGELEVCHPSIVISGRAYRIFRENNIRQMRVEPLKIVD